MIARWLGLATATDVAALAAQVERAIFVAAEVRGWQATLLHEVRGAIAELHTAAAALRAAGAPAQQQRTKPATVRRGVKKCKKARPA